jgi:hypothetical protein
MQYSRTNIVLGGFIGKISWTIAKIRNSRRFVKDRLRQGENVPNALRDLCRMLALGFIWRLGVVADDPIARHEMDYACAAPSSGRGGGTGLSRRVTSRRVPFESPRRR